MHTGLLEPPKEQNPSAIVSISARQNPNVAFPLIGPTRLNGADCIEQEPCTCKVDLDHLPLRLDVESNDEGCIERKAIGNKRIIVSLNCLVKIMLLAPIDEVAQRFRNSRSLHLLHRQLIPCRLDTPLDATEHGGLHVLELLGTALVLT